MDSACYHIWKDAFPIVYGATIDELADSAEPEEFDYAKGVL